MDYSYNYSLNGGAAAFWTLFVLAFYVVVIVGLWRTFVKAGHPGWAAIIPFYNLWIWIKIAGRPGWWLILFFIPLVNFVIAIILNFDIAKRFGKGVGFGFGLLFLGFIFFPILGFGDAQYQAA